MKLKLPSFLRPDAARRPALAARRAPSPRAGQPAALVVLIADHQRAIRRLAAGLLEKQGYYVMDVSNALDALQAARAVRKIDIVITATALPDMDGVDLACALRMTHKQSAVILLAEERDHDIVAAPFMQVLRKPFTHERLVRALLNVRPDLVRAA